LTNWQLTLGLQNLRNQVNVAFPGRDTTSDGTIGDTAHQAETSGHNPDDTPGSRPEWDGDPDNLPEVRAWDMDNDLAPGFDCQVLVDHLRALPGLDSVIRYMIYNRRMYHERDGFAPTPYTGPSPHTEHVHFDGAWTQAADNNTTFDFRLEEISVALTDDDKKWLVGQVDAIVARYFALGKQGDGSPTSLVGNAVLAQGIPNGTKAGTPRDTTWQVLTDLGAQTVNLQKQVTALTAKISPAKTN
jgi:hypothetical protein